MIKASFNYEAVIFDMDGILLDTEILFKQASFKIASELGFNMSEETYISTVGTPENIGNKIIIDAMGEDFPFEEFDNRWQKYMQARLAKNVPIKAGVKEILLHLKDKNIPLAVATSSSSKSANKHLSSAGLLDFFKAIISSDDIVNGKPHPEPFEKAAKALDVNPANCLAIEDSYNGIRAAHAANMQVVMVLDLLPATSEIEKLCHLILPSMKHLHKLI